MKRTGAPTMKDVAREAGVALGTVSKVYNGIPVGESYRRKVEAAAQRLGYQVNSYARGFKTNRTNVAALLMPSLLHPFFAVLTEEITAALMRQNYRTILLITNYDPEAERKCVAMVRQNKVDGIIALSYSPDLQVEESVPFVTIDRHVGAGVPCISSDNFGGGQLATEKLLELGCKRLLFLRIGSGVSGEADKRGAGFESVCQLRGVDHHSIILHDSETEEPFFRFLEEHCHNGVLDFDGIFCNTDRLACHVLSKLRSMGVSVPEQVQLIGYDGVLNHATDRYYCSTIVQPVAQMAEAAVTVLLSKDRTSLPALISLPVHYAPCGTTRE